MNIVIATGNAGKLKEISKFLGEIKNISFSNLKTLSEKYPDPEETGESFQENALQKALYYFEKTGIPTIAEDSGIVIDALKGELGIKTRRWGAGEKATDREWMDFFLKRMKKETNRNACFFSSSCLILSLEEIYIFSGKSEGTLLQESTVPLTKGIPLSSYFVPTGFKKTFTELSIEEKNGISHRGKAMGKVKKLLEKTIIL